MKNYEVDVEKLTKSIFNMARNVSDSERKNTLAKYLIYCIELVTLNNVVEILEEDLGMVETNKPWPLKEGEEDEKVKVKLTTSEIIEKYAKGIINKFYNLACLTFEGIDLLEKKSWIALATEILRKTTADDKIRMVVLQSPTTEVRTLIIDTDKVMFSNMYLEKLGYDFFYYDYVGSNYVESNKDMTDSAYQKNHYIVLPATSMKDVAILFGIENEVTLSDSAVYKIEGKIYEDLDRFSEEEAEFIETEVVIAKEELNWLVRI